jgi:hypothetical protein
MNTFRMISRMFAVVAVVLVIDVSAKCPYADMMNANKGKVGAIAFATALPHNADAAKAAVETAGVAYDQGNKPEDAAALALNFAANFAARKVGHCLSKHGYSLDAVAVVPGTVGDHVNPAVKEAIRAVAPQVVASLVVMAVKSATAKTTA